MDSTINLHHVQRFSRAPSLLSAAHAQELLPMISAPMRGPETTLAAERTCAAVYGSDAHASGKPFIFAGGIAVIPVYGALLHRDQWCDSWATGYDYIASRFGAALGDPDVKGILFDVNSYGGHVSGNFELCDMIYEARGKKPMASVVDSRSLSGGYSLPTAVGKIYATPSADIGSIGVVMLHMSYEEMMKQWGVKPTFIFAGKRKVDGNPYEDMSEDVRNAFQASVEKSYEKFVALVARNRGLDADVVRSTEARVYDAEEAQNVGLVDAVMPPRAAYAEFLAEVNAASTQTTGAKKMSNETTPVQTAGGEGDEAARLTAAREEGQKAAQTRIGAILKCDAAGKRTKLAEHLAFHTSMSAEDAIKTLEASAEDAPAVAAAAPAVSPLAAAMAGDEGKVAGVDGGDGGAPQMSAAERIARNHAKATGRKFDTK